MFRVISLLISVVLLCLAGSTSLSRAQTAQSPKTVVDYETLERLREEGKDLSQYELSLGSLRALAEQGDDLAQYDLAFRLESGSGGTVKDEAGAVYWYRKASEQGLSIAQARLGAMLLSGRGAERDEEEGLYWTTQSAEQGYPVAQWALGMMYKNGRGVDKNEQLAFAWMKRSAEQGYPSAQSVLGLMYATGLGTDVDQQAAYGWLLLAEMAGKEQARKSLEILKAQMSKEQIAAAETWARDRGEPDQDD